MLDKYHEDVLKEKTKKTEIVAQVVKHLLIYGYSAHGRNFGFGVQIFTWEKKGRFFYNTF